MKVFTCPRPDEVGKFCGIVDAFPDIWEGCILDVGCWSGNLKHVFEERSVINRYFIANNKLWLKLMTSLYKQFVLQADPTNGAHMIVVMSKK
jgi:hypothetical protein